MLLFSAPWAQLQGESLCPPQLCLVGIPGAGGGGYNPHTTEVLGRSPGSLAVPGGTEKALEEQGKFGPGSPFSRGKGVLNRGKKLYQGWEKGQGLCL